MGFYATDFIYWWSIMLIGFNCALGLYHLIIVLDGASDTTSVGLTSEDYELGVVYFMRIVRLFCYFACIYGALHRHRAALLIPAIILACTVVVNTIVLIHSLIKLSQMDEKEANEYIIHRASLDFSPKTARTVFNVMSSVNTVAQFMCNLVLVWACLIFADHIKYHAGEMHNCTDGRNNIVPPQQSANDTFMISALAFR